MPELPEAEVVAQQIRSRLVGAQLIHITVGRADIVKEGFRMLSWYRNVRLDSVSRYGKSVALEFRKGSDVRYIVAELGMTGLLLFQSVAVKHPQHVHVEMSFTGGREPLLRYWNPRRFGRLSLLDRPSLDRYIARRFGLDPLTVSRADFVRYLGGRRARLKPLLMQQQAVAGIGNIYANEILFRARLHPNQIADRLRPAQMELLYETTCQVLQDAIRCGGSSVRDFFAPDGTEGRYKVHHLVYGKEGQPCPNLCGRTIRRLQSERSSFVCPSCQGRRKRPFLPILKKSQQNSSKIDNLCLPRSHQMTS
ncbi:MAG TPA: bifunctional DNA-formamidopyrimidine glycosylase/DNA-(apurinic or apyrimidinic site) lyase [Nitrospira sp.]|nr:bifunctional DNA-formamidopyrimidine glycosylase/DNA-(apurinic or apyrimidinic site) lyase [Nitrospira sp.]